VHENPAIQAHLQDYSPPAGTWGYIDASGEVVIEARYDDVRPFQEGLAAVVENGLWGFIGKNGNWKISPQFIKAHGFEQGQARVRGANNKMGVINVSGDTVVPFSYEEIYDMDRQLYVSTLKNKRGIITTKGVTILDHIYSNIKILGNNAFAVKEVDKYAIIDRDATILVDNIERIKENNIIRVNGKYGLVDSTGKILIDPEEILISPGHEGHVVVKRDEKYGFYNIKEMVFFPIEGDQLKYIKQKRYRIKREGKYYLTDEKGVLITDRPFDSLYDFTEGIAAFEENTYWGYIDLNGRIIIEPIFVLPWTSSEGKFRLFAGSGFGFHDSRGKLIIDPKFDDVRDFSEGMAAYMEN